MRKFRFMIAGAFVALSVALGVYSFSATAQTPDPTQCSVVPPDGSYACVGHPSSATQTTLPPTTTISESPAPVAQPVSGQPIFTG